MEESILTSIKSLLGIGEEDTFFDKDIILYINSALSTLTHIGVGPSDGFSITDNTTKWNDLLAGDKHLNLIQTYIYMKVRLVFDPPTSSAVLEATNNMIKEKEWRINSLVDVEKQTS